MNYSSIELTKPLSVMDGVNELFSKVLGGVRVPIFVPELYPQILQDIRSELVDLQKSSHGRYDFQNLPVVLKPRIRYLQMAELHYSMALLGYPGMFNISHIGLKSKKTGLPRLGVLEIKPKSMFGLRDPKASIFSISVESSRSSWESSQVTFEPNIPAEMKDLYLPTAEVLEQTCLESFGGGTQIFISTEFAGEMPLPLESYIQSVQESKQFDSLWAIFEAPQWRVGYRVLVDKDPIILGRIVHKVLGPQYFFLGIFNPTKWESAVARNYTFGPHFLQNG